MSELKQLRKAKNMTQEKAAAVLGVSLRSYKMYENDSYRTDSVKYSDMIARLERYMPLDEEHGILDIQNIKDACAAVFGEYPVKYCILFGSYAKGSASESSDVDLLVSTDVTGLKYFGMVEKLRTVLCKKVDLLEVKQLENNSELLEEILCSGVKVYEQSEK